MDLPCNSNAMNEFNVQGSSWKLEVSPFPIRASGLDNRKTAASLADSRILSLSNGRISKDQNGQRGPGGGLDIDPGEGAPGEERKAC